MMLKAVKSFIRSDHTLIVDTTGNERIVKKIPHGTPVPKPRLSPPNLLQKAANFTKAATQHVRTGRRKATDAQVEERYAICQSNVCGYFSPTDSPDLGRCNHPSCGCNLIRVSNVALSKLRWASEGCPVGLWKPIPLQKK